MLCAGHTMVLAHLGKFSRRKNKAELLQVLPWKEAMGWGLARWHWSAPFEMCAAAAALFSTMHLFYPSVYCLGNGVPPLSRLVFDSGLAWAL